MLSFYTTTFLIIFVLQEYMDETTAIYCYSYYLNVSPPDPTLNTGDASVRNCQPERQLVQNIGVLGVQGWGRVVNPNPKIPGGLDPQLGFLQAVPSYGACIRASFYETNGEEVIVGYCAGGDRCPPEFGGQNCLYPDGGVVTQMIILMTGIPNPTALCCCENDYCNGSNS